MFMTTYNPLSPLYNAAVWLDSETESFNDTSRTGSSNAESSGTSRAKRARLRRAQASTRRTDSGYNLAIEMPGVTRDGVEVKVEGNYLTITGKRSLGEDEVVSYFSNWTVGDNVTVSGITARCEAGIVDVFIPTVAPKNLVISVD